LKVIYNAYMKKGFKLDKNIIAYLASLSNLTLNPKEIPSLIKKLEETREFIENINQINTKKVKPTEHPGNLKNVTFNDGDKDERKLNEEQTFKNTKNKKGDYFITKKIL